jgi:hypothetical protein
MILFVTNHGTNVAEGRTCGWSKQQKVCTVKPQIVANQQLLVCYLHVGKK